MNFAVASRNAKNTSFELEDMAVIDIYRGLRFSACMLPLLLLVLSTLKTILEPKNLPSVATVLGAKLTTNPLSVATVLDVKLTLELPVLALEFRHFSFYQIIRLERVRDGRHYLSEDPGAQKGFKITTKEFFTRTYCIDDPGERRMIGVLCANV